MRKEWLWVIILSLCIIIVIPWTLMRWQQDRQLAEDFQIRLLLPTGEVKRLGLEEYLVGVVAAEMPAEFDLEALKAQAVAARTYAAKRLSHPVSPDPGYDVDSTPQTQAWRSDAQMRPTWGWFNYWRYKSKIQKAVASTRGQVLISNGDYIDAFYHSSSGRKPTERAEEVWGTSRPYLQNVSSGEEPPGRFVKSFSFSAAELWQKLNLQASSRPLNPSDFKVLSRTSAGRVKAMSIMGKSYLATQLRVLLGLPSTDMEWAVKGDKVTVTTYGNGHAVGMSQYGANELAKKKYTYEQILSHFYPGAKLLSLGRIH